MLINFLIWGAIGLNNIFKRKHYSCVRIVNVYFLFDASYDRVLKDYYNYLRDLIERGLVGIHEPCILLFDCSGFDWLSLFLPVKKIALQIEHTLVKPGARDSEGALMGVVPIPNSTQPYLIRIANFPYLDRADIVFEYSRINEFNIKQHLLFSSYVAKTFCISPALYQLRKSDLDSRNERLINTITLFGNPDELRRKKFLADMASKGVASKNLNNIYERLEDLYRNTKILVNVHQTDYHDTLEELRILPALRCGVIVISEKSPLVGLTGYSKYIVWGDLSELPEIILDVQNNYEKYRQKIFEGAGFVSRMNRICQRNELLSLRAIKLLNSKLMDSPN